MAGSGGPIALAGGDEFTEAAKAMDRALLKLVGAATPTVAILPAAAQPENPYLAAAHGIAHFRELGADAYGVMILDKPTANAPALVEELSGADIVYLTGGRPTHLLESLRGSLAWERLREMHERGVVIAGSSAGAMVLCGSMLVGGEAKPALGLLPSLTVLPHFERTSEDRIKAIAEEAQEGMTYLGIHGATGVIGDGEKWRVVGPGRAHAISRRGVAAFSDGETFSAD